MPDTPTSLIATLCTCGHPTYKHDMTRGCQEWVPGPRNQERCSCDYTAYEATMAAELLQQEKDRDGN